MSKRLHGREQKVKVTQELRLGSESALVIENADGSESNVDLAELASLDVSTRVQELTASGAVNTGVSMVELSHASVIIAATVADAAALAGTPITIKHTSSGGTAAHTVTLTSGTFDGTNTIATLDAPDEQLVVVFDSAGDGIVILNTGTVALS